MGEGGGHFKSEWKLSRGDSHCRSYLPQRVSSMWCKKFIELHQSCIWHVWKMVSILLYKMNDRSFKRLSRCVKIYFCMSLQMPLSLYDV